jgi:hypothetical protein
VLTTDAAAEGAASLGRSLEVVGSAVTSDERIAALEAEVQLWRNRYEATAAALRGQSRLIVKARRAAERRAA